VWPSDVSALGAASPIWGKEAVKRGVILDTLDDRVAMTLYVSGANPGVSREI